MLLQTYLSNKHWKGKGNWPLRRGKTFEIKNLKIKLWIIAWEDVVNLRRADNIVETGTNLSWQKMIGVKCSVTKSFVIPHLQIWS